MNTQDFSFSVVDAPPFALRVHTWLPSLADAVKSLPPEKFMKMEGDCLEVLKLKAAQQMLRQACITRGFRVSIRVFGDAVFIGPARDRSPREPSPRNAEILQQLATGERMADVARQHSLSRQAVDQIQKQYFVRGVSPNDRMGQVDGFMAPYLATRSDRPCLVCGTSIDSRRKARLCDVCKQAVRKTERVRSLLNIYRRDSNKRGALRQAAYEIRKYNIKPKDLGLVKAVSNA